MNRVKKHRKKQFDCTSATMTQTARTTSEMPRLVCLKTLAKLLDSHRRSVRRWLDEAGIRPFALGTGPKGAIRYLWSEIEPWLQGLRRVN